MKKLSDPELRQFLDQALILHEVNFPVLAAKLNFNWFKQIKPRLKEPWFKSEMEETLECIKFELISKIHTVATKGSKPGEVPPSSAHLKEMIKLIDSGALLGRAMEEKQEALSPEAEARHKKRLGII